jgi:hypothetical protein
VFYVACMYVACALLLLYCLAGGIDDAQQCGYESFVLTLDHIGLVWAGKVTKHIAYHSSKHIMNSTATSIASKYCVKC